MLSIPLRAKGGTAILVFPGLGAVPGMHELLGLKSGPFRTK